MKLLVVDEEERLVLHDRAADAEAFLVLAQRRLVDAVADVEPGVRVQLVVAVVVVAAPVKRVRPHPGDELHLHRALARVGRALRRRRHRHLLHRVEPRADDGEESVGRAQRVVLDVHAVERNVDGAAGQAVDGRLAVAVRRRHAGQHVDEVHRAATRDRQLRDLIGVDGGRNRRRLRLHDLRRRDHGDLFGDAADVEHGAHAGAGA